MNDICYASELLFNVLYSDDTSIFLSHKDLQTLVQSMNNEMKHISQWLKANKLTLNIVRKLMTWSSIEAGEKVTIILNYTLTML